MAQAFGNLIVLAAIVMALAVWALGKANQYADGDPAAAAAREKLKQAAVDRLAKRLGK